MKSSLPPRAASAFTLIELLTVIAIIAVLAGLTVGGMAAAKNMRINSRGEAELRNLQTAIESYKADRGTYPPDNVIPVPAGSRIRVNPVLNPLYYELRGVDVVNGQFRVKGTDDAITPIQAEQVFNRKGFLNASADPAEPANTYLDPKSSGMWSGTINNVPGVELLVTPFPWVASWPEAAPLDAVQPSPGYPRNPNPWRYVSTVPTNNVGGFDLWAELYVGKEKRVFKNW